MKNDSSTRANFAQAARFLQVYYNHHQKLPLILDEAFLIDMQKSGFSSDFYSPRAGFRCECLYFPSSLDYNETIVVATSIPVGPSIWSFSKRLVVMKLGDKFQVDYIEEKTFQEFLKRRNAGSEIGALR